MKKPTGSTVRMYLNTQGVAYTQHITRPYIFYKYTKDSFRYYIQAMDIRYDSNWRGLTSCPNDYCTRGIEHEQVVEGNIDDAIDTQLLLRELSK